MSARDDKGGAKVAAAYRLHTGSDRRKWQWMDGAPSLGAIREAELHGWEIEYAYTAAQLESYAAARVAEATAETSRALTESLQVVKRLRSERDELAKRVAELEEKGMALVERWDTPLWKDAPHTAVYIHALRDAIQKGRGA